MSEKLELVNEYLDMLAEGGKPDADHEKNLARLFDEFLLPGIKVVANDELLATNATQFTEHAMGFINSVGTYDVDVYEIIDCSGDAIVARYAFKTGIGMKVPCITIFRITENKIAEINEVFFFQEPKADQLEQAPAETA